MSNGSPHPDITLVAGHDPGPRAEAQGPFAPLAVGAYIMV